jgi:hypothetical protein
MVKIEKLAKGAHWAYSTPDLYRFLRSPGGSHQINHPSLHGMQQQRQYINLTTDAKGTGHLQFHSITISGLKKMGVFTYHHLSALPPHTRLLSCSYLRKRHPDGALIKHKSWLCVDDAQQLYGRDFLFSCIATSMVVNKLTTTGTMTL